MARRRPNQGPKALVKTHPLAIRWFHWLNFPILATMVWSGLMIHWASSDGFIRVFGRQATPDWLFHPVAPSWWPSWMPLYTENGHRLLWDLQGRLAEGMAWHFFFMWLFLINGALYVAFLLLSGEWRALNPTKKSLKRSILVALHDLRLAKKPDQDGNYNDAQRIAYSGVIVLAVVMLVSGFAIYKPTQAYWLDALFGGYLNARWFHFWTTALLCLFFLVHVGQVVRTGWNNFRGMITGYSLEPKAVPEEVVE
jgi:thiosulfate reductase cytochrome b subunit